MSWIVIGEENGKLKMVSKSGTAGMVPKGSYLTIEQGDAKFILRVDDSRQSELFSPSPLIIEMDLTPLEPDQECQNVIVAYRVRDLTKRSDGYVDFIRPQSVARRSNQEEIDLAVGGTKQGPRVFVATIHSSQNQVLREEDGKPIAVCAPVDMFYHQIMICGKTGSGKTVAIKYLAQYFVEELEGAVLAVNVKEADLLGMDKPSRTNNPEVLAEWEALRVQPRGVENFVVYYPANMKMDPAKQVTPEVCKPITLDVNRIEPEALTGLLQGMTDIGAQSFPNIFRYWQEDMMQKRGPKDFTFGDFVDYFANQSESRLFRTRNTRGEISQIAIHPSTYGNIGRTLDFVRDFFDNKGAASLDETDILVRGKLSVIDVAGNKGIEFGSILLRDLLHRIVEAKSSKRLDVPILVIIDEVHRFYATESSLEALGELDTICRTGRSQKIGVIFSSQNPSDIPRGLSTVINTKVFFKSDAISTRSFGLRISEEEMESLRKGYAMCNIHELSLLKVAKFPMALAGVFDMEF